MIAVIGDIHGCYHTLKNLYDKINELYPDVEIFSVGDLVDRGKYNYEVVEFVKSNNIKFTAGNHDLMFYYFISQPNHPLGKSWIYNGCETTLNSYEQHREYLREHLNFIKKAPLFFNLDDCFISHAGISSYYRNFFDEKILNEPEKLKKFLEKDINGMHSVIWSRDELMNLGKLQIVGHTRQMEPYHDKSSNALYIDTSVYTGNKLSAAIIEKNQVVEIISVNTVMDDLE